jgi:hypothetical protein
MEQIQGPATTTINLTCFDNEAIENIDLVSDALRKNSSIMVVVCGDDFLGCLRSDARSRFLNTLTQMPCLKEIHLDGALLLARDVANLLWKVKGLQVMTLKEVVLQGVEDDFDVLEMALEHHLTLKEFSLEDCRPAMDEISLEPLISMTAARSEFGLSAYGGRAEKKGVGYYFLASYDLPSSI